ncbi:uncharacterized protein DUF4129 [Frondihabitans sp. PhB188]|uniref:DUF4129 domain-containing protein n=1 Tax=Frondihabitans sp. PhB188 TaxID=2485200 RepID=UPI000F47D656|nr:DUF4129 domain-containing protein [Frondihabitans sp. PhB188]ROQ36613.1 uncharacterized protein DUF4129 [Frondihabitans sp. PhB188]
MSAPLSPGADEARRLLQQELAKAEYQNAKPGLLDRVAQSFWDWVNSLEFGSVKGVPVLGILVVLAIVAVVLLVVFRVYGAPRLNRKASAASTLFGENDDRSAADLRAAAARAASAGDHDLAVVEAFRALARALDERDVVSTSPGTTAQAFAVSAGEAFPDLAGRILDASGSFDGVRYLERSGTAAEYERVRELDGALETASPARPIGVPA